MTVQTTSNLTGALRTRYIADYVKAAELMRLYDQFSMPFEANLEKDGPLAQGSSVTLNFISDLQPVETAISQLVDVTPVTQTDTTITISPTSRGNAIQVSEALMLGAYTNYGMQRMEAIGKNQMESVDLIAKNTALQASNVMRGGNVAARSSLDAGGTGHNLTDDLLSDAQADLETLKSPTVLDGGMASWMALMHPYAYKDVRTGGNVIAAGQYQDKSLIFNFELGKLGPFKLLSSAWAKMFWSAGAANASAIGTTLNGAVNALATSIVVASATNIDVGDMLTIGTLETANTHYPLNERVKVASVASTTIGIIGEGANGGLRFAHASGETVSNADSVCPVLLGSPASLAKIFHQGQEVGEFGTVVGPLKQGLLQQWESLGWKWYGSYGVVSQNRLLRLEVSISREA
jgi:N4-gp56 family major capsid protein